MRVHHVGNNQNIETLVNSGAIQPLLDGLVSDDLKLVESCARFDLIMVISLNCRALKIMLHNPGVPRDDLFKACQSVVSCIFLTCLCLGSILEQVDFPFIFAQSSDTYYPCCGHNCSLL